MEIIKKDGIEIINTRQSFGFRLFCNLSPAEMRERKEEIIHDILEKLNFEWDIELMEGAAPTPCKELNGFWSYFVRFN